MTPTLYRASIQCHCPACGQLMQVDKVRQADGPEDGILPGVMYGGKCPCGAYVTVAASRMLTARQPTA